jgi:hypothetical protein
MSAEAEVEIVIRGAPPYFCASVCPEYGRDPCAVCDLRPVTDRTVEQSVGLKSPDGMMYFIPRAEVERFLKEKNGNSN